MGSCSRRTLEHLCRNPCVLWIILLCSIILCTHDSEQPTNGCTVFAIPDLPEPHSPLVATNSWTTAQSTRQIFQVSTNPRTNHLCLSPPRSSGRTFSARATQIGTRACPRRTQPKRCWLDSRIFRPRPTSSHQDLSLAR